MRVGAPLLALLTDVRLRPTSSIVSMMVAGDDPFLPAWRELLGDELASSEGVTTWNKMRFVLEMTEENFALLEPQQKDAVHAKLVAVSKQSVPATPRLAGMALRDRKSALAKLEGLGLSRSAPADKMHVGGHTIINGKKYVIEPIAEL